ncbi:hypothetical protein [Niabella drilacis]|uniref:Uncharacterized protein n=1 Tax=Niabella drilacis (strain DSM 25811 / CCM 8410 / CCUG 62505 / LMG 26954 / E90) TaxID=1285928 RepID=A0A1G6VIZ9_NIADE|nr:hypothetical protein [Niabella drilacis]SDD52875.1 hypothetical protein SAMN04487894_11019 [Niabella drilacis]
MRYLLILICSFALGSPIAAQDQFFYTVVKDYFRVNPFTGQFSAFVNAVKTDPGLTITRTVNKTDTSLFSIEGDYQSFNPFSIRANKVEMTLGEKQRVLQGRRPIADTIMLYEITGFFDSTAQTVKALKKEYKRINNKIKRDLAAQSEAPLTNIRGIREGAITNHAKNSNLAPPISVIWFVKDDGQLGLLVALRMKYINNRAVPSGFLADNLYFYRNILPMFR